MSKKNLLIIPLLIRWSGAFPLGMFVRYWNILVYQYQLCPWNYPPIMDKIVSDFLYLFPAIHTSKLHLCSPAKAELGVYTNAQYFLQKFKFT